MNYDTGESIKMGDKWALVLSGTDGFVIGITDDREILVDLQLGDSVHSLGYCPDAPIPPDDPPSDFDWWTWGEEVRVVLNEQGFFVRSTKLNLITVRG